MGGEKYWGIEGGMDQGRVLKKQVNVKWRFLCLVSRKIYKVFLIYWESQQINNSILDMQIFNFCWCTTSKKANLNTSDKYYQEIQRTLSNHEQAMLELIYQDLANRHHDCLLTFENFLLFFGLTGLWGAKLFRQFDVQDRKLITKQEFFYGLSQTTKAPYLEKIKKLFNFFKDKQDNGIKFIDFTKMLYNYSRDQLKEILMEDKHMISELNKEISQNLHQKEVQNKLDSSTSLKSSLSRNCQAQKIIEVNYEEPKQAQDQSCYRKNYAQHSTIKDFGTVLELHLNDLTYKINFCNMITLVKEFAKRTYKHYHIDTKVGIFTLEQFSEWIQSHKKLFESYYTSFHADIWSYCDGEPNFVNNIEKAFIAEIKIGTQLMPLYGMLVEDVLILAESKKKMESPFKVIFLQGLNLKYVEDQNGYGIQIAHRDDYYQKCIIYFKLQKEAFDYVDYFSPFAGQTLHDLYNSHQVIGTGKFSIVYRCTEKQTGKSYALKDISIDKLTSEAVAMLNNQSQIMKIISHPEIVRYEKTIRSKAHIYIIAEYIEGKDLYQFVKKKKHLPQYIAAFIIGKIIEATIYLHSLEIIHRDLKPENIMVMMHKDNEHIENVKIIDFGLANHLSEILKTPQKQTIVGTPNFIAPEIILREPPTFKSDIFSIGSILYFLLSGKFAFAFQSTEHTLTRTARGEYDLSCGVWKQVSQEAKDVIRRMMDVNPNTRISLEGVLNHCWFDVSRKESKAQVQQTGFGDSSSEGKQSDNQIICLQTVNEINIGEYLQDQVAKKLKRPRI